MRLFQPPPRSIIEFFIPAFAAACTYGLLAWLLARMPARLPLDIPNERSLHSQAVPRIGGIAILLPVIAGMGLLWSSIIAGIITVLCAISFVDDRRGLPIALRFAAHGAAAFALAAWLKPSLSYPALACIVLGTWWMINLYNFMDGSDGLAGGMALFGFSAYAIGAHQSGDLALALAAATVATSACVFLIFNFHPARVFLGDAGSIPLGFLAAAMGSYGYAVGYWPAWFPIVVFSPFIVDATVVLLRRILRGEKFWAAHRSHYYQRLVQMGFGHRKTALAEYGLMAACALIALALLRVSPAMQAGTLAALAFVYAILAFGIQGAWKRHEARHA